MTQEIVDAVRALEQEKGIAADTLMDALADALLSAYRKSPGSAKYAEVDLDHETGDFRVFELILPAELEEKLLEEAAAEQERVINPETGEYVEPEDPEHGPSGRTDVSAACHLRQHGRALTSTVFPLVSSDPPPNRTPSA